MFISLATIRKVSSSAGPHHLPKPPTGPPRSLEDGAGGSNPDTRRSAEEGSCLSGSGVAKRARELGAPALCSLTSGEEGPRQAGPAAAPAAPAALPLDLGPGPTTTLARVAVCQPYPPRPLPPAPQASREETGGTPQMRPSLARQPPPRWAHRTRARARARSTWGSGTPPAHPRSTAACFFLPRTESESGTQGAAGGP